MVHSNRILLGFAESIDLTKNWPRCFVVPDRIYFHADVEALDPRDENYVMGLEKIHEYNYSGRLINSYSIENDFLPCQFQYIDDATPVVTLFESNKLQDNFLRIVRLKDGKASVLAEFGDSVKSERASSDYKVFKPLKRFGQFIWHFAIKENEMLQQHSYSIASLQNGQKLLELMDFGTKQLTYSVNWNMSEIGRTFYDSSQNFVFKISRRTTSENMTLKHLARMTVLTSFSEEFLSNRNLPQTLFEYLGIVR